MTQVTFSETWGPYNCEVCKDSSKEAWTCILTDDEAKDLPEDKMNYIMTNAIGRMACERCSKDVA